MFGQQISCHLGGSYLDLDRRVWDYRATHVTHYLTLFLDAIGGVSRALELLGDERHDRGRRGR